MNVLDRRIIKYALVVFFALMSCEENPLECFEKLPSFCNANHAHIYFEIEGRKYRFCQASLDDSLSERDSSFFLETDFSLQESSELYEAIFSVPDLFSFRMYIPSDSTSFHDPDNLGIRPLDFSHPDDPFFSSIISFTENCDQHFFSSPNAENLQENFHRVDSVRLGRVIRQSDQTILEFEVKGTFRGRLSDPSNPSLQKELVNGRYELVIRLETD